MLIEFNRVLAAIPSKPKGIIHIGAYIGEEKPIYDAHGIDNVIYIEANPYLAKQCRYNVGADKTFNYLLHEVDDLEIPFKLIYSDDRTNLGCSSIFELDRHAELYPCCKKVDEILLKTKTLNSLFKENKLDAAKFDFINMDVQGAELLVLKGASEILPNISCIMTEFAVESLYKGGCQLSDLEEFLSPLGFKKVFTDWAKENSWGDVLFIRKNHG